MDNTGIKLRTNSWHMKLMLFIWKFRNGPQTFTHLCPYFWLTIFNIIVIVPYSIILAVFWPFYKFAVWINNKALDSGKRRLLEFDLYCHSLKDDEIEKNKIVTTYSTKKFEALRRKIYVYTSYYALYEELRTMRNKFLETPEGKALITSEIKFSKAKVNSTLKFIKPVLKFLWWILMGIGVLLLVKLLVIFIMWSLKQTINWSLVLSVLGTLGALIVGIIIFAFLVVSAVNTVEAKDRIGNETKDNAVMKFGSIVSLPFVWLYLGGKKAIDFIVLMYNDNCPPIDWK